MSPNDISHPCPQVEKQEFLKPFVMLESPFAGDVQANIEYARACVRDCILRGEAPFASHLLYTQEGILNDNTPDERLLGMTAGMEVAKRCDKTVVYTDNGISRGMIYGIESAKKAGRRIVYRTLECSSLDVVGDNIYFSDAEGLEMGLYFTRENMKKEENV